MCLFLTIIRRRRRAIVWSADDILPRRAGDNVISAAAAANFVFVCAKQAAALDTKSIFVLIHRYNPSVSRTDAFCALVIAIQHFLARESKTANAASMPAARYSHHPVLYLKITCFDKLYFTILQFVVQAIETPLWRRVF